MAMIVGSVVGKCADCGKDVDGGALIRGKVYCYKCGKKHINEAVEDGLAQAKKRHGIIE